MNPMSKHNFEFSRLPSIFATMKNFSTILLRKALHIQAGLFLIAVIVFQCKQNPGEASKTASVAPIDSSFMYTTPLSEETKAALAKLEDSTRISGDLGDQIISFIRNGVYDFGEQFKFISLKWEGRNANVVSSRRMEIDDLGKIMMLFPNMTIKIESYLNDSGDPKKDEAITQARVDFIKKELESFGVSGSRVDARGMGQSIPVADNKTEIGQMLNDRIELYITRL